jgi:hypothetical protein
MNKLSSLKKHFARKAKRTSDKNKKPKTSLKTKIVNRTSHWNFNRISKFFLLAGVLIFGVTAYFWYTRLYMTPERQFWTAINNSMSTPSVVRTLSQGGSGNQVVQNYRFNFAPQRVIENTVVYTERSAVADTKIVTEGVIYPSQQYLRYKEFSNNRADGEADLSIDGVVGKWATNEREDLEESQLEYLSEQVTLAIFGNYGASIRKELIGEMQKRQVYGQGLSLPLEDRLDNEAVDIYNVQVSLRDYAELLNRAFVKAGYGEFAPLDPSNYQEGAKVNGTIIVNKSKKTIVGISFGGRDERYGNYGVIKTVERPTAGISVEDLQAGVQRLLIESSQ